MTYVTFIIEDQKLTVLICKQINISVLHMKSNRVFLEGCTIDILYSHFSFSTHIVGCFLNDSVFKDCMGNSVGPALLVSEASRSGSSLLSMGVY